VLLILAACISSAPQAVASVLAGTTITANFGEDGTMTGNSGCNDDSGPYKVTGNQIGIGPLSSTRKACSDPAGVMEQEAQYLAALENAEVFIVDGNALELREVDGTVMAKFMKK
jgi:heat shock protein HslJ